MSGDGGMAGRAKSKQVLKNPLDKLVLKLTLMMPAVLLLIYVSTVKQTIARAGDCPLIIDFNRNGRIDITGHTQSRQKLYTVFSVGKYVTIDVNGDGVPDQIDWVHPNTDAFVLDIRRGTPPRDIDGTWLFGDSVDGAVENGFVRLSELDVDESGAIDGAELAGIGFWVDDGDAKFSPDEFKTVSDLKVTSIETTFVEEDIGYGVNTLVGSMESETLGTVRMEDVWFLNSQEVEPRDNAVGRYFPS